MKKSAPLLGFSFLGSQRTENYARNEDLLTMENTSLFSPASMDRSPGLPKSSCSLEYQGQRDSQLCSHDMESSVQMGAWPSVASSCSHNYVETVTQTNLTTAEAGISYPPEPVLKHLQKVRPASVLVYCHKMCKIVFKRFNLHHVTI